MEYNGSPHPSHCLTRQKARCRFGPEHLGTFTGSRNSPQHRRRICRLLESKALFVTIVGKPSPRTSSARSSHRWKGQRHTRRMRVKRRSIPDAILGGRRGGTNPSEGYSTGFGLTCMRGVTWGLRGYIRARPGVNFVSGKLFCDSKITGKNAVEIPTPQRVVGTSRLPPASNRYIAGTPDISS